MGLDVTLILRTYANGCHAIIGSCIMHHSRYHLKTLDVEANAVINLAQSTTHFSWLKPYFAKHTTITTRERPSETQPYCIFTLVQSHQHLRIYARLPDPCWNACRQHVLAKREMTTQMLKLSGMIGFASKLETYLGMDVDA